MADKMCHGDVLESVWLDCIIVEYGLRMAKQNLFHSCIDMRAEEPGSSAGKPTMSLSVNRCGLHRRSVVTSMWLRSCQIGQCIHESFRKRDSDFNQSWPGMDAPVLSVVR